MVFLQMEIDSISGLLQEAEPFLLRLKFLWAFLFLMADSAFGLRKKLSFCYLQDVYLLCSATGGICFKGNSNKLR